MIGALVALGVLIASIGAAVIGSFAVMTGMRGLFRERALRKWWVMVAVGTVMAFGPLAL